MLTFIFFPLPKHIFSRRSDKSFGLHRLSTINCRFSFFLNLGPFTDRFWRFFPDFQPIIVTGAHCQVMHVGLSRGCYFAWRVRDLQLVERGLQFINYFSLPVTFFFLTETPCCKSVKVFFLLVFMFISLLVNLCLHFYFHSLLPCNPLYVYYLLFFSFLLFHSKAHVIFLIQDVIFNFLIIHFTHPYFLSNSSEPICFKVSVRILIYLHYKLISCLCKLIY